MKVGILGRTQWLLDTVHSLIDHNIEIAFIVHGEPADHDPIGTHEFQEAAQKANCPYYCAHKIDKELLEILKSHEAEFVLSVNWAFILNKETIEAFPKGIVNAHAGDLPRYRGNACPNWAILNGEDHIGLCMQMMVPDDVDAGPIILRDTFTLNDDSYIENIYEWLDKRIPEMLVESAQGLIGDKLKPKPQSNDPQKALRCYPRRPEDGQIDWNQPTQNIHRLIRASGNPFSGAYTHYEGQYKITIQKAEIIDIKTPFLAVPGQIMYAEKEHPVIATQDGCLKLTDIYWDNNSPTTETPPNFLRKHMRGRLYS